MLFRFWVFPDCTFLDISTMCVRKNASQPANVRAFGACTAAGCNPLKKMALPSF